MWTAPADKSARIMRDRICALSHSNAAMMSCSGGKKKHCPQFFCVILMQMNIKSIHPRCWYQGVYCLVLSRLIVSAEKRQVESAVMAREPLPVCAAPQLTPALSLAFMGFCCPNKTKRSRLLERVRSFL